MTNKEKLENLKNGISDIIVKDIMTVVNDFPDMEDEKYTKAHLAFFMGNKIASIRMTKDNPFLTISIIYNIYHFLCEYKEVISDQVCTDSHDVINELQITLEKIGDLVQENMPDFFE